MGWISLFGSLAVSVACTNPAGTRVNSRFALSVAGRGQLARLDAASNATAYAWANSPTVDGYTPNLSYQGNHMGSALTIDHDGTGDYLVHVPHPGVAVGKDTVIVTAYGSTGHQCSAGGWSRLADETQARVRCFNAAGAAVDSQFTLSYLTSVLDDW